MLWNNLIGLMFVRTYGSSADLSNMRTLRNRFRSLGVDIPMFAVDAEGLVESIDWWDPQEKVRLQGAPYNLKSVS